MAVICGKIFMVRPCQLQVVVVLASLFFLVQFEHAVPLEMCDGIGGLWFLLRAPQVPPAHV